MIRVNEMSLAAKCISWKYAFPEMIAHSMVNDRFAVVIIEAGAKRKAKLITTLPIPAENDCPKKTGFFKNFKGFSRVTKKAITKR